MALQNVGRFEIFWLVGWLFFVLVVYSGLLG